MITATPSDAPMASSRITPMSISSKVTKPTASDSNATMPGMNSWRNAMRAAVTGSSVKPEAMAMPLIFCTPWEMPMANTRNGTSIEYGSSPKPRVCSRPSCQTTAISVVINTAMVLFRQRVNHSSRTNVIPMATMKNSATPTSPSIRSPTFLAKPMMCTFTFGFCAWYFSRIFSSSSWENFW